MLTHNELVNIVKHRDAHREWHRMLASVAGVYLILDIQTGDQYVGSAYGENGLLGRWRNYADTVHGGNKQLKELAKERPCLWGTSRNVALADWRCPGDWEKLEPLVASRILIASAGGRL